MFFFLLGAVVGSFLNVVVLRFGFYERSSSRSRCASCSATLSPSDLVPILSYLWLGGRCRTCGSTLSIQYPLVELATGVLFALTYALLPFGTVPEIVVVLAHLGFWSVLVALVAYDLRHTLIPLPFIYALFGFALLALLARAATLELWFPVVDGVVGGLVTGGFFAAIYFVTRGRGMGLGDACVAGAVGLLLGLSGGVLAAAVGVWSGALVGLALIAVQRSFPHARVLVAGRRVTLKSEIPFAPFLAFGAVVAFIADIAPAALIVWGHLF